MKTHKIILLIFIVGIFGCKKDKKFEVDCLSSNLQNGIIAFYPFNNGSLNDASPSNNNLSNPTTATMTTDRNGNSNCAYVFDNLPQSGEYLTIANPEFLNELSDFSISIWYQPIDTSRNIGSYEALLSRGEDGRCPDRDGEWSVGLYDLRRAVFGHNNSVWAGPSSEVENWYHIVAIKKGDSYKIYWNGNLADEDTGNTNCIDFQEAQDIGNMFVGNKFTGKIDDIIIYNRPLTGNEITELFELDTCCE